jgi:hypothetical protein
MINLKNVWNFVNFGWAKNPASSTVNLFLSLIRSPAPSSKKTSFPPSRLHIGPARQPQLRPLPFFLQWEMRNIFESYTETN